MNTQFFKDKEMGWYNKFPISDVDSEEKLGDI